VICLNDESVKPLPALLLLILATIGVLSCTPDVPENNTPVTGLPWQIDRLPNGDTRVFGITPGVTTLGQAMELFGKDMELAIIAAPDETGALEAYYSHYSAGPITGSLILVMDIAPDRLAGMRGRGFHDGGSRRYRLHPDDLPLAFQAPVRAITFSPTFGLDDEIAQARFGKPGEVVAVNAQQKHLLYPDRGLDVVLNTEGREVLQYLAPRAFAAYREKLQMQKPGSDPVFRKY
jgi:hypothetical protein